MPYTMEQFQKDYIKAHIGVLDPEEVLSNFKAEEDRLKGLRAEQVLSRFNTEDRLKGLRAEDRLKGLRVEEIEFYLEKLKKGKS